ncbi:hypothetical protein V8C34DRAFT_300122 [Trichoderma compactum]
MTPKITSQDAGARVPLPGQIISVMLSLAATTVLTLFLSEAVHGLLPLQLPCSDRKNLNAVSIQHREFSSSKPGDDCHLWFGFIYLFLAEKAWIIRGATTPRLKSILYLVNSLGMLTIYIAVVILNFVFRITEMHNGECIIGMRSAAMIPLISFDTVINVYLTIMFLIPLKKLYSYTNMARTRANIRLRMVAFRTFCGAVCTLVSSIVNLSVLMALNVLFSAIVIQWVTSRDNAGTVSSSSSGEARRSRDLGSGMNRISTPSELHETPSSTLADISLVPTRRRSRGADDVDPHDHDTPDTSAAKVISKPASAVMVTTTIESETRPRSYNFTGLTRESSKACGRGCLMSRGSGLADDSFFSPQTKITAGGSHFLEDFGQKVDACYCQPFVLRETHNVA